jgi:pilus assembly protein Flp/PilA
MTAREFLADTTGATAIEYALLAGLIAALIIGAVASLGRTVDGFYSDANTRLESEIAVSARE